MCFISGIDKFVLVFCFRVNQMKPRNRKGRCLDFCPCWGIKVFIARVVKSSSCKAFRGSRKKKKKKDTFSSGELWSPPWWLRFSIVESNVCTKPIFTRDIRLVIYSPLSLFPSPCFLFGHWWSQAGGVTLWMQEVNSHCKLGLIKRNKPNKIVAPTSYLQELLLCHFKFR